MKLKLGEKNVINPTPKDIGRGVIYQARHRGAPLEVGVITSFNDHFVFVRYSHQHPTANGQATKRSDLTWETKGEE